jgi:hypothetical protein
MERIKSWISRLPVNGPKDCIFPSTTLVTPMWPESVLRNYVRPKLPPAELGWINFAVLGDPIPRSTSSELGEDHRRSTGPRNADHLDNYVQSAVAERKAEASKLYADFNGAGSILHRLHPEFAVSKQLLDRAKRCELVRLKRDESTQTFGFSSRPFVLCGLPVRRLPAGQLMYQRRNATSFSK